MAAPWGRPGLCSWVHPPPTVGAAGRDGAGFRGGTAGDVRPEHREGVALFLYAGGRAEHRLARQRPCRRCATGDDGQRDHGRNARNYDREERPAARTPPFAPTGTRRCHDASTLLTRAGRRGRVAPPPIAGATPPVPLTTNGNSPARCLPGGRVLPETYGGGGPPAHRPRAPSHGPGNRQQPSACRGYDGGRGARDGVQRIGAPR